MMEVTNQSLEDRHVTQVESVVCLSEYLPDRAAHHGLPEAAHSGVVAEDGGANEDAPQVFVHGSSDGNPNGRPTELERVEEPGAAEESNESGVDGVPEEHEESRLAYVDFARLYLVVEEGGYHAAEVAAEICVWRDVEGWVLDVVAVEYTGSSEKGVKFSVRG